VLFLGRVSFGSFGDRDQAFYNLKNFDSSLFGVGTTPFSVVGSFDDEEELNLCDDGTTSCISWYTSDNSIPRDTHPHDYLSLPSYYFIPTVVFGSSIILASFLLSIYLILNRHEKVLKVSQPYILFTILFGGMLGGISLLLAAFMHDNEAACVTYLWLSHLAFFILCNIRLWF